jgi:hypothetical protein
MGSQANVQRIEKKNRQVVDKPEVAKKKKEPKPVQQAEPSGVCNECKSRQKDGLCKVINEFVPKKRIICGEFDRRR